MTPLGYFALSAIIVVITGLVCYRQGVKDFTDENWTLLVSAATLFEALLAQPQGEPMNVALSHFVDEDGQRQLKIARTDGKPLLPAGD